MTEIKFYRLKDQYGCFSNFWRAPFDYEGKTWSTTEHAFQAAKFTDESHRELIRSQKTPTLAAKIGRTAHPAYRKDWDEVKDGVMFRVNYQKYKQNPELREILLSTGDARLVEHTSKDDYWGDGGDGSGRNMLGVVLMRVRHCFGGHGVV